MDGRDRIATEYKQELIMDKRSVPSSGLDRSSNVDLSSILKDLINDGLIAQSDAAEIAGARRNRNAALLHPLEIVAAKQLVYGPDHKPLSLELLT
jgi:general secretion pathway protein E